ncbi:MAG: hypothetical protein QGI86_23350 [Candidatus Poribacteria bacterium]|nr:hypothetical protein [Candidatus Poribacteria bacterium]MDP6995419.1 hypothetical protein [Candidatus Poribacteria bacterium]
MVLAITVTSCYQPAGAGHRHTPCAAGRSLILQSSSAKLPAGAYCYTVYPHSWDLPRLSMCVRIELITPVARSAVFIVELVSHKHSSEPLQNRPRKHLG